MNVGICFGSWCLLYSLTSLAPIWFLCLLLYVIDLPFTFLLISLYKSNRSPNYYLLLNYTHHGWIVFMLWIVFWFPTWCCMHVFCLYVLHMFSEQRPLQNNNTPQDTWLNHVTVNAAAPRLHPLLLHFADGTRRSELREDTTFARS